MVVTMNDEKNIEIVNGNGDLDMGSFGPKEPWGTYRDARPKFRGPKFEEMAFVILRHSL